jgi:hypothetical protein
VRWLSMAKVDHRGLDALMASDPRNPGSQSVSIQCRRGSEAPRGCVDAFRALGFSQDSDEALEAQIRGTVGVEERIEVGSKHAADAVSCAEPLSFGAAALAGHVGGDSGAVPADVGPIRVFAREQPVLPAARAGSAGAQSGGEADPADGSVGPGHPDLGGHAGASGAPVFAFGPWPAAGAGFSRRQGSGP